MVGPGQVDMGGGGEGGVNGAQGQGDEAAESGATQSSVDPLRVPPLAAFAVEARVSADLRRKTELARRLQGLHGLQAEQGMCSGSNCTAVHPIPAIRPGVVVLGAEFDCLTSATGAGGCSGRAVGAAAWSEAVRVLGVP